MRNIAVIDLRRLKRNAENIKTKLPDGVKFCAVVKADGYGHGGVEVANALYTIADCFAVALIEEGISLRLSGIDKEILVLVPLIKNDLENAVRYNLSVTVDSILGLKAVFNEAKRQNKTVKIHVAFNSGMNRFGVDDVEQLTKMLEFIKGKKLLVLSGFYTHFAEPDNKERLKSAYAKFLVAKNIVKGYNSKVTCHASASGGLLNGINEDMVRVGILLYGYYPFKCSTTIKVKPVMKVYSYVVKNRLIKKGDGLLYGHFSLKEDKEVSIIRYGYADGLNRVDVDSVINNRCMDVSAIDLVHGDKTLILKDAEVYAKKYKTISYEVLTKVAMRAEKKYIR